TLRNTVEMKSESTLPSMSVVSYLDSSAAARLRMASGNLAVLGLVMVGLTRTMCLRAMQGSSAPRHADDFVMRLSRSPRRARVRARTPRGGAGVRRGSPRGPSSCHRHTPPPNDLQDRARARCQDLRKERPHPP